MRKPQVYKAILSYVMLAAIAALSVFPFYWMFVIGSNTNAVVNSFPPKMVPGSNFAANFSRTLEMAPIFRSMLNSAFLSIVITVTELFLSSLAGFAFAKLRFRGKGFLFAFVLFTMMVPVQLGIIPRYLIVSRLGWVDSFLSVIVPGMVNAFGVYWMRQYIMTTIHDDLINAAKIDGCGYWGIYLKIILPIIKPGLATLGILTFMNVWNDYFWPSVVLHGSSMLTIQIALRSLNDALFQDYSLIMSATFVATLPLLIIFLLFNKQFIAGATEGAIK